MHDRETDTEEPQRIYRDWNDVPDYLYTEQALRNRGLRVGSLVRGQCQYPIHDTCLRDEICDLYDIREARPSPARVRMEGLGIPELYQRLWFQVPRPSWRHIRSDSWRVAVAYDAGADHSWDIAWVALVHDRVCEGDICNIINLDYTIRPGTGLLHDQLATLALFSLETVYLIYHEILIVGPPGKSGKTTEPQVYTLLNTYDFSDLMPGLDGYTIDMDVKIDQNTRRSRTSLRRMDGHNRFTEIAAFEEEG